ncbi:MAG: AmmeMemoRadiSam system protein B [Methanobacterium sp.]|nr:AmmeMemoRadiSam system protein B [Methanobacterium sp.]
MIRKPAVAGTFYESDPDSLKRRIEWCFNHQLGPGQIPDRLGEKREVKGIIVPHAGYMYSGPVAAHAYLNLAKDGLPDTFIILCPNHTGMGSGVSTVNEGQWETPLGLSKIDEEFAEELLQNAAILDSEPLAHLQEHSCEVQLPFLQYIASKGDKRFKIVPICMWMQDLETATEIGNAIVKTSNDLNRDVVLVASTDFTHYETQQIASNNDGQVLDAIKSLDERIFMGTVAELNVSMCGYGAVAANIVYSKAKGAKKAEIFKYATSGDITGDHSRVVGYASAGLI